MSKIDKKRLLKYLDSAKQSAEHSYLIELFAELENHREFSEFLKSDWDSYFNRTEDLNKDLSDLLSRVLAEVENIESKKRESWRSRFVRTYSKIAAILLLPLIIAGVYYFLNISQTKELASQNSLFEVQAPGNSRVKYTLPDSSVVWLNSGATIKYHSTYTTNRHIDLIGKAFFEVTHQSDNPFTVSFNNGTVEVLGTKFSVLSKDNGDFNVVLLEGSVKALVESSRKSVLLAPDQMLAVLNGKYKVKEVDAKNRIAWIEGKLIFRDTPIPEIARRLSDRFDADVVVKGEGLDDMTYRGTFKDENLEDILNLMSLTLPVKVKQTQSKRLPDGTFEKKKVIIYRIN